MAKQGDERPTFAIHLGALGDYILAVPALAALARRGPVTVRGPVRERLAIALAPRGPVSRVGPLPDALFGDEPTALDGEGQIVVFAKREGPLAKSLPAATFVEIGSSGHVTDVLLDGLIAAGLVAKDAVRHPVLEAGVPRRADRVVIQPGAGGRGKRWPAERFADLARRVASAGREVVCVLGPAELDPPEPSLRLPAARIAAAPSLDELVALVGSAGAYVGNDAGVTHLAAALGTPTVAIFGPTDPGRWAPRGRGSVVVLRGPNGELGEVTVEQVAEALEREWHSCSGHG